MLSPKFQTAVISACAQGCTLRLCLTNKDRLHVYNYVKKISLSLSKSSPYFPLFSSIHRAPLIRNARRLKMSLLSACQWEGWMWEDNRTVRKELVLSSLFKRVLLHCEGSNEMAVNKPCCPSYTAECLFLLFPFEITATAEQRHQGGTVVEGQSH